MKLRVLLGTAGALLAAACSDSPSQPSGGGTTTTQPFQITCPTPVAAESTAGSPIAVTYTPPTITAGKVPVLTTCTPASGSSFNVGSTTVNCVSTDATPKTVTCSFPVNVTRPGTLSATKFLAFGDSITEGKSGAICPNGSTGLMSEYFMAGLPRPRVVVDSPVPDAAAYPGVLSTLLRARYAAQVPAVTNVGRGGDRVSDTTWGTNDDTKVRLDLDMAAYPPQIVLLLEGANDMIASVGSTTPQIASAAVVKGLRDLAREAKLRGASQVFIATLLPQRAFTCRGAAANLIAGVNVDIRSMVAADGHVLVDVYNEFGGVPGTFIDFDGLHPNASGYQKLAQIFFDKIKERLEVPR